MAQKSIKMSIIRQVLTGRKKGKSTREMARMYHLSRSTIQRYLKMAALALMPFGKSVVYD